VWRSLFPMASISVTACLILLPVLVPGKVSAGMPSAASNLPITQLQDSHDAVSCVRCHLSNDVIPGSDKDVINYDVSDLCVDCHGNFTIHPVGIPINSSKVDLSEMTLPVVDDGGVIKMTCLTCHHFHGIQTNRFLLRKASRVMQDRYKGLCCECHEEEELKGFSPHSGSGSSCGLCHNEMPGEGEAISSQEYAGFQQKCDFCHGMVAEDHFKAIDPLADPQLAKKAEGLNLVMIDGEYTCYSCHDPHGDLADGKELLKQDYIDLSGLSRLIDPHWKDVMCVTCHSGKPKKGTSKLRMDGDVVDLCRRCHDNYIAPAFLHPVGLEPSLKVHIPDEMPLQGGLITCQTCHDSSQQETGEDISVQLRTNPNFLRIELSPKEFCTMCHIIEEYSRINVHLQIDETGSIIESTCAGCHYILPEDSGDQVDVIDMKYDPREFCLLCHKEEIYMENHPAGPHLVEPSRDVYYALLAAEKRIGAQLPLYDDRITCATCHDSHQKGVLKRHDWIESDNNRVGVGVRAEYREILCTGCHD